MFKTKLFAIICSASSVVVAATTALTLAVSGPRNTQSLHMLSDNNAVAYGITNIIDNATSGIDKVTEMVETIENNKSSLSGSFIINSIEDYEEYSGFGAGLQIDLDTENSAALIKANAALGSIELINGAIYIDKDELIAEIPALFEGIISASLDNLESDIQNSYIGQKALESLDMDELQSQLDELTAAMAEAQNMTSQFDFDYEAFYDGLCDVISDAYFESTDAMTVEDMGKKPLASGDSYQCYRALIPVKEVSYIVRDVVLYMLNNEDLQEYVQEIYDMQAQSSDDYDLYSAQDISSQFESSASIINSYWGQVVSSLEQVLGKNIEFTVYLTDSVEAAGFEFTACVMNDGTISYDINDLEDATGAFVISADMTGGAEIGDYTNVTFECINQSDSSFTISYSSKNEENGDFTYDLSMTSRGDEIGISAEGSYTEDGEYFDYKMDSLKFTENGKTVADIGFALSFQPIDSIEKPSGTPEYDIWEMDEDEFSDLIEEIIDNIDSIQSLLN